MLVLCHVGNVELSVETEIMNKNVVTTLTTLSLLTQTFLADSDQLGQVLTAIMSHISLYKQGFMKV